MNIRGLFGGGKKASVPPLVVPTPPVDYSRGLREAVLEAVREYKPPVGEPEQRLYLIALEIGAFPTEESFTDFGKDLQHQVIRTGGHSGNEYNEWFKEGAISFPLNVQDYGPNNEGPNYPNWNAEAAIKIQLSGRLTVGIDELVRTQLLNMGYLDKDLRPSYDGIPISTCMGTGELGRVLDIITNTAPKYTGIPILGAGLKAQIEVRIYVPQTGAELIIPNNHLSSTPQLPGGTTGLQR